MSSANNPQGPSTRETERNANKKEHVTSSYSHHIAVPRPPYGKQKVVDTLKEKTEHGEQDKNSNDFHMNIMLQRWAQEDLADGPYHNIASVACSSSESTSAKSPSTGKE